MENLKEGNFYNIEDEISHSQNPSEEGIERWKNEVIKQLYKSLKNSNNVVELTGPNVFSSVLKEHFSGIDIYLESDESVNKNTNKGGRDSVRFFGYDYEDFCTWKVPEIDRALHMNEVHWREEAQTKSVFK